MTWRIAPSVKMSRRHTVKRLSDKSRCTSNAIGSAKIHPHVPPKKYSKGQTKDIKNHKQTKKVLHSHQDHSTHTTSDFSNTRFYKKEKRRDARAPLHTLPLHCNLGAHDIALFHDLTAVGYKRLQKRVELIQKQRSTITGPIRKKVPWLLKNQSQGWSIIVERLNLTEKENHRNCIIIIIIKYKQAR